MSSRREQHLQQWVLDKRDIQAIREGRAFRDGVLPSAPKQPAFANEAVFFEDERPTQKQREKSHGIEGFLRGRRSETRLVEVVECLAQCVPWIYGARLATREEDARKIDIVVATDRGDLYLQAKSSHTGMRKFSTKKYPHIACVIVHDGTSLADEVLEKLERLRRKGHP